MPDSVFIFRNESIQTRKVEQSQMRNIAKILMVVALLVPATMAIAQTTTTEVKSGTVVAVFNDQLVVKMSNGQTRQITVPPGFKFNVDGKEVGLNDLTPGTHLT